MPAEASNLKIFPVQLMQDRDFVMPCINQSGMAASVYNAQPMGYSGIPFAATLPISKSFYQQPVCDSAQAKTSMNTDSGLTYNISATRKRSSDPVNQMYSTTPRFPVAVNNDSASQFPYFFGDDILPQIQQYQIEIDTIISQHTKRIKLELEERRNKQARFLVAAIGEGVTKKLKEKEDQIQKMGKLNFFLQERVKSLYVENQLWREMAQTNEATANSLRSDLEQVLAHVGGEERLSAGACGVAAVEDDVESCCGSSDHHEKDHAEETVSQNRNCKRCGERESCVLLLPCRHLCLCNVCGSGSHQLQSCPVCNATMNATLHVNMSS
ncbi:BOI-related E3 ubiquitin-protein ligase 1-like [Primulina tabacum]|uniref:BOI-related E3 ubiquitin-protein ligase 1-like n=1 Tax=Primulina tabacum TaxID=48773 RepID=UPI003F5A2F19